MCVVQQGVGGRGDNHEYCWHLTDPTVRVGSHVMYDPAYRLHHLCTCHRGFSTAGDLRRPCSRATYLLTVHTACTCSTCLGQRMGRGDESTG